MTDEQIFKNGSTTYYWSSKFFSEPTRTDVFKLYSFVRVADNFVDEKPQDKKSFNRLVRSWRSLVAGKKIRQKPDDTVNRVVQNMYDVAVKYDFDFAWIDDFLASMKMDLQGKTYKTMDDTLAYIYGSAEVIGLMMFAILRPDLHKVLKRKSTDVSSAQELALAVRNYAKLQGRAMQYINFIRDIDEDLKLKRCYFPQSELSAYGLPKLDKKTVRRYPAAYKEFIEAQITHYKQWQREANKGFKAIPRRQRIALRASVDMYNWTANKIAADPFIVFDKKVKPSKYRVIKRAAVRSINA